MNTHEFVHPPAPQIVDDVVATSGAPLTESVRAAIQMHVGSPDLGAVRIHTDPLAVASAEAVNAHAYTVGNHVVFGRGQYRPETSVGRHVLMHELTHVVQQRRAVAARPLRLSHPSDTLERDADHMANAGAPVRPATAPRLVVARQVAGTPVPAAAAPTHEAGPSPADLSRLSSWLIREGYVYRVSLLLPEAWRTMSEAELTSYLTARYSEQELRSMYLARWGERQAIKAQFRGVSIASALVIGLFWARDNIRREEWSDAALKIGGLTAGSYLFNRLLYARDLSAEALMLRRAGQFGRWFQGAARTNRFVNFILRDLNRALLLYDIGRMFMSGGLDGPNIPFDLIIEIDLDDPTTWREPSQTVLDLGFNIWYQQMATPRYPDAFVHPMYLGKVEGSVLRGIGRQLGRLGSLGPVPRHFR